MPKLNTSRCGTLWHGLRRKRMVEEFGEISQISIDFKKILMEIFTEVFFVQIRWTWASPFGCISQPFSINRSDPTVTAFKVSSFALQGRRPGERDLIRNMHTHTHQRKD